jgi:hypothetical protein
VKNARPAYMTATNHRLRLIEDSARIMNADNVMWMSAYVVTAGIR